MVLTPTLMLAGLTALAGPVMPRGDGEIPAFSRKYRVGCTRCHTAAPKLNVLGEAFRLNGYRMPATEPMPRGEDVIPLGEEPWRDLWPRGIWPGELAATVPIAAAGVEELELINDENPTQSAAMISAATATSLRRVGRRLLVVRSSSES